jgi:glycosyltransferase involved in cell wall biosynthesis
VLSALDVACVITADTAFGRYSYPAKLCEAMACEVPVVATGTDPVRWMLKDDEHFFVPVGNASAMAKSLLARLANPTRIQYPKLPTWNESAAHFEQALVHGREH